MSALKKAYSRVGRSRVMFTEVASVAVLLHDAGKAAEWYRQKLGFEVSVQGHWVTAKPPASSVVLHLCGKCEDWEHDRPGGHTGIFIKTDDKEKTYKNSRRLRGAAGSTPFSRTWMAISSGCEGSRRVTPLRSSFESPLCLPLRHANDCPLQVLFPLHRFPAQQPLRLFDASDHRSGQR